MPPNPGNSAKLYYNNIHVAARSKQFKDLKEGEYVAVSLKQIDVRGEDLRASPRPKIWCFYRLLLRMLMLLGPTLWPILLQYLILTMQFQAVSQIAMMKMYLAASPPAHREGWQ
jgi:hypothetical protein